MVRLVTYFIFKSDIHYYHFDLQPTIHCIVYILICVSNNVLSVAIKVLQKVTPSNLGSVIIQFIFTPSESRHGPWERQQLRLPQFPVLESGEFQRRGAQRWQGNPAQANDTGVWTSLFFWRMEFCPDS